MKLLKWQQTRRLEVIQHDRLVLVHLGVRVDRNVEVGPAQVGRRHLGELLVRAGPHDRGRPDPVGGVSGAVEERSKAVARVAPPARVGLEALGRGIELGRRGFAKVPKGFLQREELVQQVHVGALLARQRLLRLMLVLLVLEAGVCGGGGRGCPALVPQEFAEDHLAIGAGHGRVHVACVRRKGAAWVHERVNEKGVVVVGQALGLAPGSVLMVVAVVAAAAVGVVGRGHRRLRVVRGLLVGGRRKVSGRLRARMVASTVPEPAVVVVRLIVVRQA
mmetsp:Transcript_23845/g.76063  ORF Transcript_23845/g.76063 Transcript_23845/m.76063 type:complete len:276 (-) Transcript_23845:1231-2058(-)